MSIDGVTGSILQLDDMRGMIIGSRRVFGCPIFGDTPRRPVRERYIRLCGVEERGMSGILASSI